MKLISFLITAGLGILSGSCATMPDARQAQYEKTRNDMIAAYAKEMYSYVVCSQRTGFYLEYDVPCPPLISVIFKGKMDLISKKVSTVKNKQQAKKLAQELSALTGQISAQMVLRYKYADFQHVDLECKAEPGMCDDGVTYELAVIHSHNQFVMNYTKQAVSQYDVDYAQSIIDQRKHDELINAINNPPRQPTNCTGIQTGNFINVHCN